MGNYEGKLGEWLKYVQQQVDAVSSGTETVENEAPKKQELTLVDEQPNRMAMRDRFGRVMPEDTLDFDSSSVIADPSLLNQQPELRDRRARVFEDSDVPDVEDFLPFLKESGATSESKLRLPNPEIVPDEPISPPRHSSITGSEGTGEPRPMLRIPQLPKQPEPLKPEISASAPVAEPIVEPVKIDIPTQPQPRQTIKTVSAPSGPEAQELWGKLPRHIQLLVGQSKNEVAQNSYKKGFKESRDALVARLLDPTLSLEETARVLNVCPTTVRRYTNRGALRHLRTAGNQRRFRLSDVLGFLESQTAGCE